MTDRLRLLMTNFEQGNNHQQAYIQKGCAKSVDRRCRRSLTHGVEFLKWGALHLCFRRVGDSSRWEANRQVQARHANPVVGHPIINVEAVRQSKIVAAVDAGGENDVGDGPLTFLRQRRCQHRFRRAIENFAWMLLREHHHPGRIA